MKPHIAFIRKDSKYWMAFLCIGIVFIIIGCYSVLYPFAKHASIARVIGVLSLLTGIIKARYYVQHKEAAARWKMHVSIGIANALIGIFLVSYQGVSILILPFLLSFWILSSGIALIEETTDINIFHTTDVNWMLTGGVLTVVAFLIAAYLPILGSLTAVLATAVFLIVVGLFYILLSLRLRVIKKEFKDVEIS